MKCCDLQLLRVSDATSLQGDVEEGNMANGCWLICLECGLPGTLGFIIVQSQVWDFAVLASCAHEEETWKAYHHRITIHTFSILQFFQHMYTIYQAIMIIRHNALETGKLHLKRKDWNHHLFGHSISLHLRVARLRLPAGSAAMLHSESLSRSTREERFKS